MNTKSCVCSRNYAGLLWRCLFAWVVALLAAVPATATTIVRFETNLGDFQVELFDATTPITVNNFLNYVNSGRYDDTLVHRSALSSGFGIIQGGGYDVSGAAIVTDPPIPLEYVLPNVRGTISMARTVNPNSATSQWFINTTDNSVSLVDFAVFGQVLGNGMAVVDAINALPRANLGGAFAELPYIPPLPVNSNNLVEVNSISVVPEPSTLALACTASMATMLIMRRRPAMRSMRR